MTITNVSQTFFERFRTDAVGSNFTVVLVNGGENSQSEPGVEVTHISLHSGALYSPPI